MDKNNTNTIFYSEAVIIPTMVILADQNPKNYEIPTSYNLNK
jgi:hypothetical protein